MAQTVKIADYRETLVEGFAGQIIRVMPWVSFPFAVKTSTTAPPAPNAVRMGHPVHFAYPTGDCFDRASERQSAPKLRRSP